MDKSSRKGSSSQISNQYPIETWQNTATTEVEKQPQGVVARIFENCQESLRCLVQNLDFSSVPKRDRNILRRCHAVLLLWGEGHGVSTGALDAILDRSKSLRQMTLSILNPMRKVLSRGLQYHITLDKHDDAIKGLITAATKLDDQTRLLLIDANDHISECESDSESSCDEGIANNLQELVQSIKVYTTCLTDLGSALVCPALEPKFDDEPEEATPEPRLATDYRPELMIIKSPEAVSCLPRKLIPIPLDSRRRNEQPRKLHAHITPMQNERSCFTGSEFYDSGVGTSIPNADSTFASYVVDIDCAERFSGFAWDVESHSDLASERGKIVYGDIRGVGGWLKPFLVSDFVPQLEVTFEKDGGMSNVDSEPAALRQAQEKEFPDARKSIDNTAKPDVGLGSSVSRQSIELTDSESKRVAEFFTSPTGVSTRKDDVTEISIQHVLGVNNVESNHTTWEDQNLTMTGYWDERGKQVHESLQKTHAPSEIVFPSGEPKVMQELLRSILSCNRCWKDRQKCLGNDRPWPAKCDRCYELGLPCSGGTENSESRTLRRDRLPSDSSSLAAGTALQIPSANNQSHQDIDIANSTLDFGKPLDPGPGSAVSSPHKFFTWNASFESHNESSLSDRGKPDQSNASALKTVKMDLKAIVMAMRKEVIKSSTADEVAIIDVLRIRNLPVETPTMKNTESQQLYTCDSANALDPDINDTSNLDILADSAARMRKLDAPVETFTQRNARDLRAMARASRKAKEESKSDCPPAIYQ